MRTWKVKRHKSNPLLPIFWNTSCSFSITFHPSELCIVVLFSPHCFLTLTKIVQTNPPKPPHFIAISSFRTICPATAFLQSSCFPSSPGAMTARPLRPQSFSTKRPSDREGTWRNEPCRHQATTSPPLTRLPIGLDRDVKHSAIEKFTRMFHVVATIFMLGIGMDWLRAFLPTTFTNGRHRQARMFGVTQC